jgi:mannose-6-phosphate isomerase-like protein (cupin superfamily)
MGAKAFVIDGSHAALVANDNCDFRYRATAHHLPTGIQVPARSHERAETHFMVVDGMIEFMVGGAAGIVLPGDFVRVPAGVVYAYRNAGDSLAHILVRQVNPATARIAARVTGNFAA